MPSVTRQQSAHITLKSVTTTELEPYMRDPDPSTLTRVCNFLTAASPFLDWPLATKWLATALVRTDGGAMLDPPRLGPVLRFLGFRSVRYRQGARRLHGWIRPGAAPPPVGRPRGRMADKTLTPTIALYNPRPPSRPHVASLRGPQGSWWDGSANQTGYLVA
jgi:hypothetical protein